MTLGLACQVLVQDFARSRTTTFQTMRTEHLVASSATIDKLSAQKLMAGQMTVTDANGKQLSLGGAMDAGSDVDF